MSGLMLKSKATLSALIIVNVVPSVVMLSMICVSVVVTVCLYTPSPLTGRISDPPLFRPPYFLPPIFGCLVLHTWNFFIYVYRCILSSSVVVFWVSCVLVWFRAFTHCSHSKFGVVWFMKSGLPNSFFHAISNRRRTSTILMILILEISGMQNSWQLRFKLLKKHFVVLFSTLSIKS